MTAEIVYLFSSNIRPLYEQDILDVLAAPTGTLYSFRYEADYVTEDLAKAWGTDRLVDTSVLVHFSLQQVRKYHRAVFVPVRRGIVTQTTKVGDFLVIEFEVGEYVSLLEPGLDERGRPDYAERVLGYADRLESQGVPCPYDASASLAPDVVGDLIAIDDDNDVRTFARTARFLQGTDSFASARFLRFLSLREPRGEDVEPEDGVFALRGGHTYELRVFHSQPADVVRRESFRISADEEIVRIVGDDRFEIASRYDVVSVAVHAIRPSTAEAVETVLVVRPDEGVQGPALRLRIRVTLPAGRTAGAIAATSLGLVLVGLPGLLSVADPLKVAFLGVGTLVAATSAVLGLRRTG